MQIYLSRWVVPVSRSPLEHGALAVEDGRIAWVGLAADAPAGERIDLGNSILLPGLVNAHSHLELTAMRGWLEELPFRRWVISVTKARRAVLDPESLLASARVGIAEGLLAGITTFADTSESGFVHEALRGMGVRGIMYLEVFGPTAGQCEKSMRELRTRVDVVRARDTALVRSGVSPHAPYSVSDELFAAASAYASSERLPMAIHAAESEAELLLVRDARGDFAEGLRNRGIPVFQRGASTIQLLERCGALVPGTLLIHCVRVNDDDIVRIAASRCAVVHCPASNAKLGHGVSPVAELMDAAVPVALGTDSVASNNRMDILEEARLAVLMQRARLGRHDVLSASQALSMATLGAARAIGLEHAAGSLDVGKAADFAVFAAGELRTVPVYRPEEALIFALSGRRATLVAVAGQVLVRDGALCADLSTELAVLEQTARSLGAFGHQAT